MHDCKIFSFFNPHSVPHVITFPLTHKHAHAPPIFSYLKSPHIPRVSCSLQTILVTFQEKLQEEPAKVNKRAHVCTSATKKSHESIMYMIICYPAKTLTVKGGIHYFSETGLVGGMCACVCVHIFTITARASIPAV